MKRLSKLDIFSFSYHIALIYAAIGLIFAILMLILSKFVVLTTPADPGMVFGYWIIIIFPIVNFVGGYIMGLIIAFIYNVISKNTGGVKIELK